MTNRRLPRLPGIPGRPLHRDVDDELRFHVEMAAADLVARGVEPNAARTEAERRFGTVSDIRDACLTIDERRRRRAATADSMSALMLDLRYALRSLRNTPMLTLVGSLTLMLGVGATTAIFSVVDGVLLRPLPYPSASRLVVVTETQRAGDNGTTPLSYPEFLDWQQRGSQIFHRVGASFSTTLTLTGVSQPAVMRGMRVSANLPAILGVKPIRGRTFRPEEDAGTADRVVMLSETFWRQHFNGDPSIVGRSLELSGYPFTVIGIYPSSSASRLPSELTSASGSDYWQGLRLDAQKAPRGLHFLAVIGELKAGLNVASARPRIDAINRQLRADSVTDHVTRIADLSTQLLGSSRALLEAIFGAVLLVLLVACANVANLLLARASTRQREIAIRTALGASRGRILSQLLGESVIRALLGGILGVALAYGCVEVLHGSLSVRLPRFADVSIDGRVLAFAVTLSIVTGMLFGIVPALRSARTDPNTVMREGGRGVAGSLRRDAFRRSLIVGEIVMSFVLLAGAGLLIRSFDRLDGGSQGLQSRSAHQRGGPCSPRRGIPTAHGRLRSSGTCCPGCGLFPGVTSAAVTSNLPIEGRDDRRCHDRWANVRKGHGADR